MPLVLAYLEGVKVAIFVVFSFLKNSKSHVEFMETILAIKYFWISGSSGVAWMWFFNVKLLFLGLLVEDGENVWRFVKTLSSQYHIFYEGNHYLDK